MRKSDQTKKIKKCKSSVFDNFCAQTWWGYGSVSLSSILIFQEAWFWQFFRTRRQSNFWKWRQTFYFISTFLLTIHIGRATWHTFGAHPGRWAVLPHGFGFAFGCRPTLHPQRGPHSPSSKLSKPSSSCTCRPSAWRSSCCRGALLPGISCTHGMQPENISIWLTRLTQILFCLIWNLILNQFW